MAGGGKVGGCGSMPGGGEEILRGEGGRGEWGEGDKSAERQVSYVQVAGGWGARQGGGGGEV